MVNQFAAPPINPIISITPLATSAPSKDSTGVPPQLANVPPGTTVQGFVINRDANSNPILRTSLGDLLIKSDVFLKTGSEVVFRVDLTQASHARIITIDGLSPQEYASQQGRVLQQDMVSASPVGNANSLTALAAQSRPAPVTVAGILLNTAALPAPVIASNPMFAALTAAQSAPLPHLAKLQQGAVLKVTLLQLQLPADVRPTQGQTPTPSAFTPPTPANAQPMPTAATGSTSSGTPLPKAPIAQTSMASPQAAKAAIATTPVAPSPPPPNVASPTPPAVTLQQQQILPSIPSAASLPRAPLTAQNTSASAPTPPMATAASPRSAPTALPPNALPGVVIGHEQQQTVVQLRHQTILLQLPQKLPVGTQLQVQVEEAPASSLVPTIPLPQDAEQLSSMARDWDSLDELLHWARTNEPALARDLAQQLPTIGHKMTSGVLFFLAAVKGGDIRQWLGNRLAAQLELKAPALAARMKQDMVQFQQLLVDSPLQNWTSMMLPMLFGEQLDHMRLFVRQDRQQDEKAGVDSKGQRFILEVDLSHLGDLQFDGFVRQQDRSKSFDLIIRSARALPAELGNEIRGLFEQAMEASGLRGYLGFQVGSQHFVRPMAEAKQGKSGSGEANTILA